MKTIKIIGIFLAIMLGLFMIKGMILGAMFFFFTLKIMAFAAIVAGLVLLHWKIKNRKDN